MLKALKARYDYKKDEIEIADCFKLSEKSTGCWFWEEKICDKINAIFKGRNIYIKTVHVVVNKDIFTITLWYMESEEC